ncbi:PilZ domain-containing protein [Acetivibrio clariflavus]|uniref:PilZ domain-containing protein n=1 Tax=Acetivibrio clariflavus (strain DSM 19732 / NBRC 101661 / EBR45) TaxID=720554 RepID=G8M1B2_ACECE|nr:PilZ domain-containing protein [Acetivibrio clariflavus]AEV68088.1 PilZ domain-containing protein [Acetivibrio clariflavus DSM 19732]
MSELYLDQNSQNTFLSIDKSLNKLINVGTGIEIKHINMSEYLNATVVEKTENTLRIITKELIHETFFFPGDCVSINYSDLKNLFVISGKITKINSLDPLDFTVLITRIEKMKNLRKYQRYYVSLSASLDVPDISERLFVVVKNISSGGVKINCSDYLPITGNIVGVEVILDRINNLFFKGAIVRKGWNKSYFEYGIEIQEISESNYKCLNHYLNWLSYDYKNI